MFQLLASFSASVPGHSVRGRRPRRRIFALAVLAALLPLLAAPSAMAKGKKAKPGKIVGTIVNKAGEALEDVRMTVTSTEDTSFRGDATSNGKGVVSLEIDAPSGTYKVHFEKEGYADFEAEMVVNEGDQQEFTAELLDAEVGRRQEAMKRFNDGATAFNGGDLEAAKASFLEAVEMDPEWAKPYLGLANVYNQQGAWAEAATAADRYLEAEPGDTQALSTAYVAYSRLGDTERKAELLAALGQSEMAPTLAAQVYNEGVVEVQAGNDEAAIAKFEQAREIDPDLLEAYTTLGTLYYNAGRYPETLEILEELFARDPDNAQGRRVRFLVFDALEDSERADEAIAAYFEVDPQNAAQLLYRRADMDFRDGFSDRAKASLERILAADPDMPQAHYTLGKIYLSTDSAKAKEHLERFLALAPDDPEAGTAREMLSYL